MRIYTIRLDITLAQLRAELDTLSPDADASKVKAPVYPVWTVSDLAKAKRLAKARENAIKSVTTLIEQRGSKMPEDGESVSLKKAVHLILIVTGVLSLYGFIQRRSNASTRVTREP